MKATLRITTAGLCAMLAFSPLQSMYAATYAYAQAASDVAPESGANLVTDPELQMRINMSELERDDPYQAITEEDLAGLSYLDLTGAEATDWSFLPYCTQLSTLLLGNSNFSDARLLTGLPLERLVLSHTATDHLDELARLTTLVRLDLSEMEAASEDAHAGHDHGDGHEHDGVVDAAWLAPLTNLRELGLLEMEIEHADQLSTLTNLELLDVSHTAEFDPSVLAHMPNLTDLQIDGVEMKDFSVLRGATKLQILRANDTGVHDVSALSSAKNLRVLELARNPIADISALSGLTKLEELSLNRADLQDNKLQSIDALAGMTRLVTLNLDYNDISSLEPLAKLANLQHLRVSGNKLSTLSGLENAGELVSLEAARNPELSDISALKGLDKLDAILLDECAIADPSALSTKTDIFSLSAKNQRLPLQVYSVEGKFVPTDLALAVAPTSLPDSIHYSDGKLKLSNTTTTEDIANVALEALDGKYSAHLVANEHALQPTLGLMRTTFAPHDTLELDLVGFMPHEEVELTLHSDPISLGTVVVDEAGSAHAKIALPNVAAGKHELVARGLTSGATRAVALELKQAAEVTPQEAVAEKPAPARAHALPQTGDSSYGVAAFASLAAAAGLLTLSKRLRTKKR